MEKKLIPAFLIGTIVGSAMVTIGFFATREQNNKTITFEDDNSKVLNNKIIDSLISEVEDIETKIDDIIVQVEEVQVNDEFIDKKHTFYTSEIFDNNQTIILEDIAFDNSSSIDSEFTQVISDTNTLSDVVKFDANTFDITDDVEEIFADEINLYHNDDAIEEYKRRTLEELDKICEQLVEKIA